MTLEEYKHWFILEEGHWYVSKVKQYKPSAILLFSKGLKVIDSVINAKEGSDIWKAYHNFRPKETQLSFLSNEKRILINDYSKLFICLFFLKNELIDLSHLESSNIKKFKIFSGIQKEFIEGKDYDFFVSKYTIAYLKKDLTVYYRNFKSWLGKFGFYGEYPNKTTYITDVGREYLNNSDDIEIVNAIFLNQIKKFQLWNPTIDDKYQDYRIRPYYLLLSILLRIEEHYFSIDEYVLFITKIKSHSDKEINDQLKLLYEFRNLEPEEKKAYLNEINFLDKKKFRKRKRTNLTRLKDSASKEISCYGYGGLIEKGTGRYVGNHVLINVEKAKKEFDIFTSTYQFIKFKDKLAWISHLGSLDGISIDSIIGIYLDSGMSIDNIKDELKIHNEGLANSIQDKIYEREIEDYYIKHITEINSNLEVVKRPSYGRQFSTHIGPIDILCIDKVTKGYVICELKRGQTSDETVGQLLRYMGWVYEHLSDSNATVKGILIGSKFDKKVDYSLKGIQSNHIYNIISKFEHPFDDDNRPKI